jgi:hypothetical protein
MQGSREQGPTCTVVTHLRFIHVSEVCVRATMEAATAAGMAGASDLAVWPCATNLAWATQLNYVWQLGVLQMLTQHSQTSDSA